MAPFTVFAMLFAAAACHASDDPAPKPKIVLLAGKKSHGPVGNGIHDYGWSVKLLHAMLEASNIKDRIRVEHHLDGWPTSTKSIDDAATIAVISDGRDGDLYSEALHLESPHRVLYVDELMKRGCGFVAIHFSTFAPDAYSKQMLEWCGGHFDWETDGRRHWYSAIATKDADVLSSTPTHPIARGVKNFRMHEEFYFNIRFPESAAELTPILEVLTLGGRIDRGNVVAWAKERPDGGRGFGTTCGHFYDNWKNPGFRKTVLNALAWTAKVEFPPDGVEAPFFTHEEIDARLQSDKTKHDAINVLITTGNDAHRWHNWEKTTPAIVAALRKDSRISIDVHRDPEDFGKGSLTGKRVLLLNYCNWFDPRPLSEPSRKALLDFVNKGGGLIVVHFANGAFHWSLPMAGGSDWPEYRNLVRRVWNHQPSGGTPPSGHDSFGRFQVLIHGEHPIVKGLKRFEVTDELYFHQHGKALIEPMLVAHSKITKAMEPLAFAYTVKEGRVFQMLLGHSEKTYDAFEVREVLRRAAAWTAKREIRPLAKDDLEPAPVSVK